ncbi:MAG: MerR family DNA-binding transcriptional regulator [Silicimonas sp.]|nr:MerR family DNA-binding transcriptional regulator [Silicimonas sp.]RZW11738.1 MAG: MerR family DNA-binding transcriptional regulator [Paracoccaceae bacterium]MBT8423564.1 MerR family DNA-binding transcriptional regulator [Silicimonas sp.]NND17294.1 MerR family DNA-binding transcriptional regulator [Silicimonas sp.]NND22709.1 MerR family DNA-binding transcriptional regulator [Silicimonas sp.]
MTDTYMSIREMCQAFDVTPRTLRFYESKELLFPVRRGTRRLFTRRDRARLKLILRGKRFGFSLEDIRQLLDLYDTSNENLMQMTRAYELGQQRLSDMETQRNELNDAISDLKRQLEWGEEKIAALRGSEAQAAE